MLFLFNKAKIISYLVSVFTVVALLFVANSFVQNKSSMPVTAEINNEYNKLEQNKNIISNNSILY